MTYKQIETSREIRLWIGQIAVPAVACAMAFPQAREAITRKAKCVKKFVTDKIQRGA